MSSGHYCDGCAKTYFNCICKKQAVKTARRVEYDDVGDTITINQHATRIRLHRDGHRWLFTGRVVFEQHPHAYNKNHSVTTMATEYGKGKERVWFTVGGTSKTPPPGDMVVVEVDYGMAERAYINPV